MITWWLGCLILVAIFIVVEIFLDLKFNLEGAIGITFVASLAVLVIFLMFCSLNSWSNSKEENITYQYVEKQNINSLEDNLNTEGKYAGSFILGYGSVGTDLYYYAMVGDDTEGYIVRKFESDETYLIPEENVQPYYIEKHKYYDVVYGENFLFGGLFKPMESKMNRDDLVKKELHLPKDYIKKSYNIDLK